MIAFSKFRFDLYTLLFPQHFSTPASCASCIAAWTFALSVFPGDSGSLNCCFKYGSVGRIAWRCLSPCFPHIPLVPPPRSLRSNSCRAASSALLNVEIDISEVSSDSDTLPCTCSFSSSEASGASARTRACRSSGLICEARFAWNSCDTRHLVQKTFAKYQTNIESMSLKSRNFWVQRLHGISTEETGLTLGLRMCGCWTWACFCFIAAWNNLQNIGVGIGLFRFTASVTLQTNPVFFSLGWFSSSRVDEVGADRVFGLAGRRNRSWRSFLGSSLDSPDWF